MKMVVHRGFDLRFEDFSYCFFLFIFWACVWISSVCSCVLVPLSECLWRQMV